MHNILVFTEVRGYLNISMEEHLKELGYNIINVGTSVNDINGIKEDITAILVYADMDLLKKIMQQESIISQENYKKGYLKREDKAKSLKK